MSGKTAIACMLTIIGFIPGLLLIVVGCIAIIAGAARKAAKKLWPGSEGGAGDGIGPSGRLVRLAADGA